MPGSPGGQNHCPPSIISARRRRPILCARLVGVGVGVRVRVRVGLRFGVRARARARARVRARVRVLIGSESE